MMYMVYSTIYSDNVFILALVSDPRTKTEKQTQILEQE